MVEHGRERLTRRLRQSVRLGRRARRISGAGLVHARTSSTGSSPALTRLGSAIAGSRVLEVQGRKSGEWRRTPVNPLEFEGERYLVAPRGHTQWVRQHAGRAAAAGSVRGRKRRGVQRDRGRRTRRSPPVLRAYLKKWKWEVGAFFGGVGREFHRGGAVADRPDHPAFRISRLIAPGAPGSRSSVPGLMEAANGTAGRSSGPSPSGQWSSSSAAAALGAAWPSYAEPSIDFGEDARHRAGAGVDFNGVHALAGFLLFPPASLFPRPRPKRARLLLDLRRRSRPLGTRVSGRLFDKQPAYVSSPFPTTTLTPTSTSPPAPFLLPPIAPGIRVIGARGPPGAPPRRRRWKAGGAEAEEER